MPSIYYQRNFEKGQYYHIYNRGALGSEIFRDDQDYQTFTFILSYYLRIPDGKPLSYLQAVKAPYTRGNLKEKLKNNNFPAALVAYTLLTTSFSLVLQENVGSPSCAISSLMKRLSVTYAMYFNSKYGRAGSIFAGKYKMAHIPTLEHLLEVTKYLHRIPSKNNSYSDYLKESRSWVRPNIAIDQVRQHNTLSYKTFTEDTPANIAFLGKLVLG